LAVGVIELGETEIVDVCHVADSDPQIGSARPGALTVPSCSPVDDSSLNAGVDRGPERAGEGRGERYGATLTLLARGLSKRR